MLKLKLLKRCLVLCTKLKPKLKPIKKKEFVNLQYITKNRN